MADLRKGTPTGEVHLMAQVFERVWWASHTDPAYILVCFRDSLGNVWNLPIERQDAVMLGQAALR